MALPLYSFIQNCGVKIAKSVTVCYHRRYHSQSTAALGSMALPEQSILR
jgi:hypothetical protein